MTDGLSLRVIDSRSGFTVFCSLGAWLASLGLMLLLPMISPNSAVQEWSAQDSLYLSTSIVSGPFAFASSFSPSLLGCMILIPLCFAYAVHPGKWTRVFTLLGWMGWTLVGILLTFESV